MGNRGQLHDAATKQLSKQTWATSTWIICLCDFKGRKRELMSSGSYTELFFLDEVTALAAGHRPCYECRRLAAKAFARAAQSYLGRDIPLRAEEISKSILKDVKPHIRRYAPQAREIVDPRALPDGAMFACNDTAYLKIDQHGIEWTFDGYTDRIDLPDRAERLTPRLSCGALADGYVAAIHGSAFK